MNKRTIIVTMLVCMVLAGNSLAGEAVWSSVDIQLYGYIKVDAVYDQHRVAQGNYVLWVESEETRKDDDTFNLTSRQSRLGMMFKGPEAEIVSGGRIEFDFYGGTLENKPELMLRHAYLTLDWPDKNLSLLAGQTWDIFSPLFPRTLNYLVSGMGGNIGYRRPQLRLTKKAEMSEDVDLKLQLALARTIGHSTPEGLDPGDSGEDAGFPGVQGRIGVTFPLIDAGPTTIGVSGHWAQEEYDLDDADDNVNLDSWSINLDLCQPITENLAVDGEIFKGKNLDTYTGSIGRGIETATLKEVESKGGWVAVRISPANNWKFNLGASSEDIEDGDVVLATARTKNTCYFGNATYSINEKASVGLEISQHETEYKSVAKGDSYRVQSSFLYKF